MTINLFWKRIFRMMQSTGHFENKIAAIASSPTLPDNEYTNGELSDLERLEEFVQSPDFAEKKDLYQNKKYRDTDEYRIMQQYEKLLNDPQIKLYYQTLDSELLRQYLAFKSDPDSLGLKELSILEVSEKIESLKQFEQSKEYRNYTQFHDSLTIREFEELKRKVAEPVFQESNAFWANPDRWETSYEYRMEQRYREMKGISSEGKRAKTGFSLFKKYQYIKLRFNEEFEWHRPEESRWSAGFHSGNPRLRGNYSFINEWQANSGGRNVHTADSIMSIHTVELPGKALAWDVQEGFVERDFRYTSDVVQTAATFRQKYGIFTAKLRCEGRIHHALWLSAERKLPHINLFHFDGENIRVGNAGLHKVDGVSISGVSQSQFYIYTLEWTPRALVWYINNVEVYRTTENIPHEALYLGINSFIPKKMSPKSGKIEVDWIKVYEVRD